MPKVCNTAANSSRAGSGRSRDCYRVAHVLVPRTDPSPLWRLAHFARNMRCYFGSIVGSPPGLPGGGMTGVLPEPGGGGTSICGSTPRGGRMTPLERSSRSLRSSAGGACPSVSVFGVRSRSDMVGCPHACAIIVAATMAADIHASAMVARATAVSFPVRFTNRTHANTIGFHCARVGRPPRTGHKQKIFQRLHNPSQSRHAAL
jgi:hypothetical protein